MLLVLMCLLQGPELFGKICVVLLTGFILKTCLQIKQIIGYTVENYSDWTEGGSHFILDLLSF